jgi:membrane-bound lytic murein transglycosylase B
MSDSDAWGLDDRRSAWVTWAWRICLVVAVAIIAIIGWALVQLSQLQLQAPRGFEVYPAATVAPPVDSPAPAPQPAGNAVSADPAWTDRTAATTGIPTRALHAYATAALVVGTEQPSCGIGWNTLAGIGAIESGHGSHDGSVLQPNGYP